MAVARLRLEEREEVLLPLRLDVVLPDDLADDVLPVVVLREDDDPVDLPLVARDPLDLADVDLEDEDLAVEVFVDLGDLDELDFEVLDFDEVALVMPPLRPASCLDILPVGFVLFEELDLLLDLELFDLAAARARAELCPPLRPASLTVIDPVFDFVVVFI